MLKQTINQDYLTAFKNKDVAVKNLLSVVKGEIQTIEKNTGIENLSDEEVLKILTKTAKSLKIVIDINGDVESKVQLELLERYLPKQISRETMVEMVTKLANTGVTNTGSIMKEFSNVPVDRKVLSEVIKEVIN